MPFRFKLETLLTYRRNLEEQAQLKLARELNIRQSHLNRLNDLIAIRRKTIDDLEVRKQDKMTSVLFSYYIDYIRHKDREIEVQLNTIAAQENVIVLVRSELMEKVKARKIIERLREKKLQSYLQEELTKELKEHDDQAVMLYAGNNGLLRERQRPR